MSDGSAATRPLTRTLTLDDVVKETTEMETDRRHHHHQEEQGPGGSELGGGGDGGSATPADERGSAGGAGSGGVGVEDSIDGGCSLVFFYVLFG